MGNARIFIIVVNAHNFHNIDQGKKNREGKKTGKYQFIDV